MADLNPFDLLDDEAEDPSQLIAAKVAAAAAQPKKALAQPKMEQAKPAAKLPSKPLAPAQSVREVKAEFPRGGGRGGGRGFGRGRGGGGFNREPTHDQSLGNREFSGVHGAPEEGDAGKPYERRGGYIQGGSRSSFRGGRRGGFSDGDAGEGERPRRVYERRSGTGRGNELKREGSGRGNWGTSNDELAPVAEDGVEGEKDLKEKPSGEEDTTDGNKEVPEKEAEQKEPEDKEMTLEEYEKVLEEKRKALQALKTAERKVDAKAFASMQQLNKKNGDEIFVKLGSDKDKKKESTDKEEKVKKSVSINEFLKPAEGERYYNPGGRGRGRGRGNRGGYSGGSAVTNVVAPSIEDPGHFPTLGAK